MKLVSVIVPVYRSEQYLGRCVDSLISQSYGNLEIILVDDGSPDACPAMCDEYAARDARIKVIHKENAGQGYARNDALRIATGDYVTFVDSDDWIEADHIERLACEMTRTGADIVLGTLRSVSPDGVEKLHTLYAEKKIYDRDTLRRELLLPLIGPEADFPDDVQIDSSCCSNMYSMELIKKNELLYPSEREAVAEDTFFNIFCLAHADKAVVTEEAGYCYYDNNKSTSRKYDRRRFGRTLEFYRRLNETAEQCGFGSEAELRVIRSFLMKIRVAIRLAATSDMKYKEKMLCIREMLEHPAVNGALQRYPIEKYGCAVRLLSVCMKKKMVCSVYAMTLLREKLRNKKTLGVFTRAAGLDR